jgi:hypothetical protein
MAFQTERGIIMGFSAVGVLAAQPARRRKEKKRDFMRIIFRVRLVISHQSSVFHSLLIADR